MSWQPLFFGNFSEYQISVFLTVKILRYRSYGKIALSGTQIQRNGRQLFVINIENKIDHSGAFELKI